MDANEGVQKHKTVTEMSHEPSPVPVPATTHTTVD